MSVETELKNLLEEQIQKIVQSFDHENRMGLIELLRAVDSFLVGQMIKQERTETDGEISQLIAYSLPLIFEMFLDDSSHFDGAPLFRSMPDIQAWADSVLQYAGRIEYGKKLIEMCNANLCILTKVSNLNFSVELINTSEPIGVEASERENFQWLTDFVRAEMQKSHMAMLSRIQEGIWNQMASLVKPWRSHYIQYNTTPEIDTFYQHEGLLLTQVMAGNDSFPKDTVFGGIEFGLYCAAVATLTGWAIKHLGFCLELLKKNPELDPRNILTITTPHSTIVESLSLALEVNYGTAERLIEVVTMTTSNKGYHCDVPGESITPLYVEIGNGQLLKPLYGAFSNPFLFMLKELRRRYPKDWDRGVNGREKIFREELYDLFPGQRFHCVRASMKLRSVKRQVITDIDACVVDKTTNTVGLFQLKWQDMFGSSLRKRGSQKRNILHTGNEWVEKTVDWLSTSSNDMIKNMLAIKDSESWGEFSFKLFVLGRNAAHFSGPGTPDGRAAWGQWYQFVKMATENYDLNDPISTFHSRLVAESPLKKPRPVLPEEILELGQIRISFLYS